MKYFLAIILLLSSLIRPSACTIFNSFDGNTVLVGNNEDYDDTNVSIRFYPASKAKYGRVLFKIDKNDYPFGGMNDQGLFFDWCSLPRRSDIKFPSGKKNYNGTLCEKMLEECASVNDAIDLYNKYNDPWLYEGHIMVVDKTGASAVIEWGTNSLAVIKKTGNYQVLSNFNLTDQKLAGWYPCPRYNNANKMLGEASSYTPKLFKQILNTVHQEGQYPTIYSNIYEPCKGVVTIFKHHSYENEVVIDLNKELKKGEKRYKLFDIFCELTMEKPLQNQVITNNSATFTWSGNAVKYELYCSKDSLFDQTLPKIILNQEPVAGKASWYLIVVLIGTSLFGVYRKKKIILFFSLLLIITLVACSKEELFETCDKLPVNEESCSIEQLAPSSTYYWKIAAYNNWNIRTESSVQTFITE